jgi:hypothetical protein
MMLTDMWVACTLPAIWMAQPQTSRQAKLISGWSLLPMRYDVLLLASIYHQAYAWKWLQTSCELMTDLDTVAIVAL